MSHAEKVIHNSAYALLMGTFAVIAASVGFLASHWITDATAHAAPRSASTYPVTFETVTTTTESVNGSVLAQEPVPASF